MEWWQVVDNQDRKNHQHIASYQMASYSVYQRNHFSYVYIILQWKGYYYNGLKDTVKLQLICFKRNRLAGFQR